MTSTEQDNRGQGSDSASIKYKTLLGCVQVAVNKKMVNHLGLLFKASAFLLLLTSAGFAQALGTPSSWTPSIFNINGNQKDYELWGGLRGNGHFSGSTAEESAGYLCELNGLGTPIKNEEYRSDGRFYFKCATGSNEHSVSQGSHNCPLDEQVVVIDLDVHTQEFLSCTQNDPPPKDGGCPEDKAGNPCNVATGNKYQSETDLSNNGLTFIRSYNSTSYDREQVGLGKGWRNNHQKTLVLGINSLTRGNQHRPWRAVVKSERRLAGRRR